MDAIPYEVSLDLDPATGAYIEQLVVARVYGHDAESVVVALIDEGIRKAIKDGLIKIAAFD